MNETQPLLTPAEQNALSAAIPVYQKARMDAEDTLHRGLDDLWNRGWGFGPVAREMRLNLRDTCVAVIHTAWMDMAIGTGPIVGWILDNCEVWNEQALMVLQLLAEGKSMRFIDGEADHREWCETYWGDQDEEIQGFRQEFADWMDAQADA